MLEPQRGFVPGDRDPAELPRLVAVDRVPHHVADEAADVLEAGPAVELRHADRHLVAPPFGDEPPAAADIGLARAGADAGIGLHALDKALEVARGQVEIEIELAQIGEVGQPHGIEAGIECLDHARSDGPVTAIWFRHDADPVVTRGIVGEDRGRFVGRSVVHDDPEGRAQALRHDAVERPAHIRGLVPARRDEQVGAVLRDGSAVRWGGGHGSGRLGLWSPGRGACGSNRRAGRRDQATACPERGPRNAAFTLTSNKPPRS